MTCKDWGMSGRIHSQWHSSAASQSLHTIHPSKKCHPLWSLQHTPNPLPFDHYSSNTQQSPENRYRTSFFSQSVPPSISLIVCLSFSEKKPTCVSTLSWHGRLSPAVQACSSHKARHLKQLRSVAYVAFGVRPSSWELPSRKLWVNATYPGRQIESVCEREREVVRPSFSLRWRGGVRGELVTPLRQSLSSLQVMDTLTTH